MKYSLIIDDSERDYLLAIVQSAIIRDAARVADADPKRDADTYAKSRAALHVGAALLAALNPSRIEVATSATPQEIADPIAEAISRENAERRCVHGRLFSEPCEHCSPS